MINYIIRRIAGIIPLFLGITLVSFFVIHLAPGKPTDLTTQLNPKISFQTRAKLEHLYGLDKPLTEQYLQWLGKIIRLDFGTSFIDGRDVFLKIKERIPVTLLINLLSIFFILLIAVPIGVISAVKQRSFFDRATTIFVFIGFAMPSFWLALLLMSYLGVQLQLLPVSGIKSIGFENLTYAEKILDFSRHLILPVFVSAFGSLAGMSRYMRTSMSEVINQDYIRTARAKGLSEKVVIYKHALRNALLPIVTILGLSIPGLIGGSVIFESIFAIPGMGRLFYEAVMSRDYSVIMAILVIGAVLTLVGNLLADISYACLDPRIKYVDK